MITAIIRNKENTLVLELPHSIYDIYEKLQSIGIMQPPKQIPLIDNEDEDIGVKLFSESDFGQHLLLTLNEKNTIADANMLPVPAELFLEAGMFEGDPMQMYADGHKIVIENIDDPKDIVCDGDCDNCPIADMDCDGDCEDCPCSDNCDESEAN